MRSSVELLLEVDAIANFALEFGCFVSLLCVLEVREHVLNMSIRLLTTTQVQFQLCNLIISLMS